jgi:hypothetical protein
VRTRPDQRSSRPADHIGHEAAGVDDDVEPPVLELAERARVGPVTAQRLDAVDVRARDAAVERGDCPAAAQRLDHRGAAEEGRPTDDEQLHGSTLAGRGQLRQGRSPRAQR